MKKCLILCMSCNSPFFKEEEKIIYKTWGKDVFEGKYPNMNIVIYTASKDGKIHYHKNTHKLEVPTGDDLYSTFEKTKYAFNVINAISGLNEYDFILRTNCSTYINVGLLNNLLNIFEEDNIYCGEPHCSPASAAPFNWAPHPMGSCMVLSKKLVDIILNDKNLEIAKQMDKTENPDKSMFTIDDTTIGSILNCFWINNGEDFLSHYKKMGIDYIYNHTADKPLYPVWLCYGVKLYNFDISVRKQYETKNIEYLHNMIKDKLSNDISYVKDMIVNTQFKLLYPETSKWVTKEELKKLY